MAKGVLRVSKRTMRRVQQGFAQGKRYKSVNEIKNLTDLRTFFYEYSLFVGDYNSIPGLPNFNFLNSSRQAFLKAGRVVGDVRAITNTMERILGDAENDATKLGERYFRRVGGRVTGKVLMAIPGQNPFSRAARSVVGANMQKEFDGFVKTITGKKTGGSKPDVYVRGQFDVKGLTYQQKITKLIEKVAEDTARQAYTLTPVWTGKLRGSIKVSRKDIKVKGGNLVGASVTMGGPGIDYAPKIEYGSGAGFNEGVGPHINKYFSTPNSVKHLKSGEYRRAVNPDTGKGAMLRRGGYSAMKNIERMTGGKFKKYPSWQAIIREAENTRKV